MSKSLDTLSSTMARFTVSKASTLPANPQWSIADIRGVAAVGVALVQMEIFSSLYLARHRFGSGR